VRVWVYRKISDSGVIGTLGPMALVGIDGAAIDGSASPPPIPPCRPQEIHDNRQLAREEHMGPKSSRLGGLLVLSG
jgi:hypothetical protein